METTLVILIFIMANIKFNAGDTDANDTGFEVRQIHNNKDNYRFKD